MKSFLSFVSWTTTLPRPTSVIVPSQRSETIQVPSLAVTVPAAPSARNAPLAVAASVRTMPLIGRTALPAAQARESAGRRLQDEVGASAWCSSRPPASSPPGGS